jgi:hypothetical protein
MNAPELTPILFFRRIKPSGNKYLFAALSEEAMKPLDAAEGFTLADTITEDRCLAELDPVLGPLFVGFICDELRRTKNFQRPMLIPDYTASKTIIILVA